MTSALALLEAYATPAKVPSTEPQRIARLLSLKVGSEFDDIELAGLVAAGLPTKSAALAKLFRNAIGGPIIPEATMRRAQKKKGKLPKQHSETLYEMYLVVDLVSRTYRGDTNKIKAFMIQPHMLLGGQTPFSMARSSSAGARTVLKVLQRAEAGVAL